MGTHYGMKFLCQCTILLCALLFPATSPQAEDAGENLKAYGRKWNEIQSGWDAEQNLHKQTIDKLKSRPQTPETQRQINDEINRHTGRSKEFAGQRQVIQDKIISEANRRTASGQQQKTTSKPGSKTAGTDPTSGKGRGMAGDGDYGSGPRTADKVQGVLDDMGITAKVKTTPSTVEIGDGMNMTVNKEGALGRPGSGAHQTQVEVDAHVKDTYVSESMEKPLINDRGEIIKPGQPGRDYVQVQDHKKKALGGLNSDPADLPRNPEGARDMVKGATKSLEHLPPAEAEAILNKHGLTPDDMTAIKEGRANVTPENAEKIQNASREVIETAETRTRAKADAEMAQTQKQVSDLEASGNKAEARRLREQLVDSRTKITETTIANTDADGQGRTKSPAATDTPDGKPRGPSTDTPDSTTRGPSTDSPDGKPRGPAPDTPDGKFGKAVDKFGKGMQAVDILSGAQDFKEAAKKGDVEGMGKAAINTADGLTGGAKGTVDTLVTKGSDRAAAQDAIDQANRTHLENQNQRIAIDLQRSGMSKDEIKEILDAKAKGDEGPLRDSYDKLSKPIPPLEVEKPVEGDDTVIDRTGQVATGIGEKVIKAGTFVKEAGEDVGEIATGLTEKGVAGELIDQQKKNLAPSNIADGFGAAADTIKAGRDEARARDSLADKLVEKGASPEDAAKAAEAWANGDRSQLDALKEKLGLPVATTKSDGKDPDGKQKTDKEGAGGTAKEDSAGPDGKPKNEGLAADGKSKGEHSGDTTGTEATAGQKNDGNQRDGNQEEGQPIAGDSSSDSKPPPPEGPIDHAGQQVDPGSYGQGDTVVNPDGTEYEKQGDTWVPTGNNYGEYDPKGTSSDGQDPLKGNEPSTEDTPWGPAEAGQGGGSTLDNYADQHNTESQQKTQDSMTTMGQKSQMDEAANVSNQVLADARNIRETGARDADAIQTESTQETSKQDSKDSWGNVIGNAVTQGIQEGAEEFGETLGEKGADAVTDDIFGEPNHGGKGSQGGGEGHNDGSGNASAGGGSSGQDQHDDSSASSGSSSGHGGKSGRGHDSGGKNSENEGEGEESGSDGEPGAGDDEPGAGDDEPGSADDEAGAGEDEPGAGDDQLGAGDDEPGAGDDEPGAGDDEPGAGDDEPGAGDDEPGATDTPADKPENSDKPPDNLVDEAYQKGLEKGRYCKEKDMEDEERCKDLPPGSHCSSSLDAVLCGPYICDDYYSSSNVDPKAWASPLNSACKRGYNDGNRR